MLTEKKRKRGMDSREKKMNLSRGEDRSDEVQILQFTASVITKDHIFLLLQTLSTAPLKQSKQPMKCSPISHLVFIFIGRQTP